MNYSEFFSCCHCGDSLNKLTGNQEDIWIVFKTLFLQNIILLSSSVTTKEVIFQMNHGLKGESEKGQEIDH